MNKESGMLGYHRFHQGEGKRARDGGVQIRENIQNGVYGSVGKMKFTMHRFAKIEDQSRAA